MGIDTIGALAKLILFTGITVSIVGISIQVMRFIGAITENIHDFRKTIKNIGILTDDLIQSQKLLKEGIVSFVNTGRKVERVVKTVVEQVIQPITMISGILMSMKTALEKVRGYFVRG